MLVDSLGASLAKGLQISKPRDSNFGTYFQFQEPPNQIQKPGSNPCLHSIQLETA
jgi:hypothetical protein